MGLRLVVTAHGLLAQGIKAYCQFAWRGKAHTHLALGRKVLRYLGSWVEGRKVFRGGG